VPVYDLRVLYAEDPVDTAQTTVIIVRTGMERDLVALVVDELGDLKALPVIGFDQQDTPTDPDWNAQILFSGMSRLDHRPVMILDVGRLVRHGHAGRDGMHGHADQVAAARRCS
jgi:chemotaxis signal transduction protein